MYGAELKKEGILLRIKAIERRGQIDCFGLGSILPPGYSMHSERVMRPT